MKAVLCEAFAPIDQLQVKDIPSPTPKPHEVLIDIKAAGVNFPDGLMAQGLYQFKPELPFVLGSEFAGVVSATGEKASFLPVGTRVAGFDMTGAFAEQMTLPAMQCLPLPDEVSFEQGATFLITYGTAYHALKDRAQLKTGETVVVLGAAGGVGIATVALAKLMGAKVVAVASTAEKLAFCKEHGADVLVNYKEEDLSKALKALPDGVDVICDPVGGAHSEAALRRLNYGGRLLVIGFTTGDIPKIPLNLPLLKSCQIVGVFWGKFLQTFPGEALSNHTQLLNWIADRQLNPPIQRSFPLEDIQEALHWIGDRKVMGKIVLVTE
ncbi:MAG: NADPH:quinone oxidoreductase family protein [Bacteroidota bacterium]